MSPSAVVEDREVRELMRAEIEQAARAGEARAVALLRRGPDARRDRPGPRRHREPGVPDPHQVGAPPAGAADRRRRRLTPRRRSRERSRRPPTRLRPTVAPRSSPCASSLVLSLSCSPSVAAGTRPRRAWLPPVDAPVVDPFREPAVPVVPGNRGIEYGTAPGHAVRGRGGGHGDVQRRRRRHAATWSSTTPTACGRRTAACRRPRWRAGDVVVAGADRRPQPPASCTSGCATRRHATSTRRRCSAVWSASPRLVPDRRHAGRARRRRRGCAVRAARSVGDALAAPIALLDRLVDPAAVRSDITAVHHLRSLRRRWRVRQPQKENHHGRRHHAADARGRRPLRAPDPPLEPEDEALHLRRAQRHLHHRPRADARAGSRPPTASSATSSPTAARSCSSAPRSRPRTRSSSYAEKCGMPYVNERWLGGMLTNFETISKRVGKMQEYERMRDSGEFEAMPKKEALLLDRELEKLQRNLGGIRDMTKRARRGVHARHEEGAHRRHRGQQARHPGRRRGRHQLSTPTSSSTPIPGNDDAIRSGTPAVPGHRRRRRGGPLHRQQAQPGAAAAAPSAPPRRRPSSRPQQAEARRQAAAGPGRARGPPRRGPRRPTPPPSRPRRRPTSPPPSRRRRRRGRRPRRAPAPTPPRPRPPPTTPTPPTSRAAAEAAADADAADDRPPTTTEES